MFDFFASAVIIVLKPRHFGLYWIKVLTIPGSVNMFKDNVIV